MRAMRTMTPDIAIAPSPATATETDAAPSAAIDRTPAPSSMRNTDRVTRMAVKTGIPNSICPDTLMSAYEQKATEPYHYDHIVPLAMGGVHAAHNLQIAHATCNLRKGARVD